MCGYISIVQCLFVNYLGKWGRIETLPFIDYSSRELQDKLYIAETDLASAIAGLEAFWGGWWPLSQLLEIRAISRAAICTVVTGLVVVAPGFSEGWMCIFPCYPSFPSVPYLTPASQSPCIYELSNCGSPLCQTLGQTQDTGWTDHIFCPHRAYSAVGEKDE